MNPNWKKTLGTVLMDPPDDTGFLVIRTIINAVTIVTGTEGGYQMAITCNGTIMFFHLTEQESDDIRSILVDMYGENYVQDKLCYAYDSDFEEECE